MLPATQTVRYCYYCMYRTLADVKPFGRRAHGSLILQNIFAQLHSSFLHCFPHLLSPLVACYYTICGKEGIYASTGHKLPYVADDKIETEKHCGRHHHDWLAGQQLSRTAKQTASDLRIAQTGHRQKQQRRYIIAQ